MTTARHNPDRLSIACALFLIALAMVVKCVNLGHQTLRPLDESFHAVVARNMVGSPWRPVLYEPPFLPVAAADWQLQNVWMHKPPLAMWQMSAFIATLGESTFWLRFPSVLLGAASCVLTLLIGRRLFDTQTGCIAGVMQAWLAATWMLAHGYQFSDHIDTALVFYVELSILFVVGWMNKRSQSAIILAGVTCGLAVLTKSFVGLTPLAMVVVLALISRDAKRVGDAITMTCATVLTAAPWLAWCWVMFPDEFLASKALILKHLSSEVELWGGPWDRVAFDYWPRLFYPWFVALAGLGVVGTIDAIRARDTKWLITALWFAVVAIPHLLAPTKTPSATVTLLPAGLIMLAAMISRRPTLAMLSLASCVVVELGFNVTATFGPAGVFSVVLSNWPWVLAIAILIAARWVVPEWRHARLGLAGLFSVLLLMSVRASTRVTQIETPDVYAEVGALIRQQLPANGVLLIDTNGAAMKMEHTQFLFFARRSAYPVDLSDTANVGLLKKEIEQQGGRAYVVTRSKKLGETLMESPPWRVAQMK